MESYLTLHTVVDNGLVLDVGEEWQGGLTDSNEDIRLPKKRRYCGEDQSRHAWDSKGQMSTEPPTPVLIELPEYMDEGARGHDGLPVYYLDSDCVRRVYLPDLSSSSRASSAGDGSPASSAARIRWSEEDDKQLITLVSELGHDWPLVASRMEGRTSKQVKERWTNQLDPTISTEPWSAEDDQLLVELIRELGHCWCEISRRMRGRTESMVKNRFHANLRKRFGNHIFDSTVPLPPLTFKPKSLKSKKTVISEEVRAAAAEAAEKAAHVNKRNKTALLPQSSYFDENSDDDDVSSSF